MRYFRLANSWGRLDVVHDGDRVRVERHILGDEGGLARELAVFTLVSLTLGLAVFATVWVLFGDWERRLPALLESVRDLGVAEVMLHRPSLEDVFLHHTGARFEERDA